MKKITMLMASLLFLAACSNDEEAKPKVEEPKKEEVATEQQQDMTEEGFITQVTTDQILVNNIYFTIPEGVSIKHDDGKEQKDGVISDIRTGMKVVIGYKGPLGDSFPMEGEAETVSILSDKASAEEAEALTAFIEGEKLARLLMLGQPIVRDNEIGFLFTNMENGKMSEVKIDLDTHEYTIGGE